MAILSWWRSWRRRKAIVVQIDQYKNEHVYEQRMRRRVRLW